MLWKVPTDNIGEAKFTPEMGVGGNHTPINFPIQAVKTARVVVPPGSKDTGHPDSHLFPVRAGVIVKVIILNRFGLVSSTLACL